MLTLSWNRRLTPVCRSCPDFAIHPESQSSANVVVRIPELKLPPKERVHLPESQIQSHVSYLLATYAASSVVLSPFAGAVADRTSSRQLPFLAGLTALMLATALLFIGSSVPVLVVARVAQGASSAFVWTVGLALW